MRNLCANQISTKRFRLTKVVGLNERLLMKRVLMFGCKDNDPVFALKNVKLIGKGDDAAGD